MGGWSFGQFVDIRGGGAVTKSEKIVDVIYEQPLIRAALYQHHYTHKSRKGYFSIEANHRNWT